MNSAPQMAVTGTFLGRASTIDHRANVIKPMTGELHA
jgi:hypothetical protein